MRLTPVSVAVVAIGSVSPRPPWISGYSYSGRVVVAAKSGLSPIASAECRTQGRLFFDGRDQLDEHHVDERGLLLSAAPRQELPDRPVVGSLTDTAEGEAYDSRISLTSRSYRAVDSQSP